jgi:hypothetical protein
MNGLIDELRREHMHLVDTLKDAHRLGILQEEGRKKLMSLKIDLLSHIKKENEKLYPPLRKVAEMDENFIASLDFFSSNMEAITEKAMTFFNKYSTEGNDMEFIRDYKELLSILSERINNEENVLFKEFFSRGL